MPFLYRASEIEMNQNKAALPDFSWKATKALGKISGSKYLYFDIKSLPPNRFSYPYHSHRNAEELFVILEGEGILRSPLGFKTLKKGDVVFFEEGPDGAHQIYNHGDSPLVYLDLCTRANIDVCDYPDSGKINVLPAMDIFETNHRVSYFKGEENVRKQWPEGILKDNIEDSRSE